MNINKFIKIHELIGYDFSPKSVYRTILVYGVFKLLLLFMIPVIGVFYRTRLTWRIILAYFYFILWHFSAYFIFEINFKGIYEIQDFLIIIAIFMIPMLSIYILNRARTFKDIYSVEKKSVMLYNLIAFILGCGISMLVVIMSKSQYYEGLKF